MESADTETIQETYELETKLKQLETDNLKLHARVKRLSIHLSDSQKKKIILKKKLKKKKTKLNRCLSSAQPSELTCSAQEEAKKLQSPFCSESLQERDETISEQQKQLAFLKEAYKELEAKNSFSLEYIKLTVSKLIHTLPIEGPEPEQYIELLLRMLGFSAQEKLRIRSARESLCRPKPGFLTTLITTSKEFFNE